MITPNQQFVAGAGSATLATAVSNLNTVLATTVTAAQAVSGVIVDQVTTTPAQLIFNGTLYIASASVMYKVVS